MFVCLHVYLFVCLSVCLSQILDQDSTTVLINNAPLPDELEIIRGYRDSGGDMAVLEKHELFVAAMLDVPRLKPRLIALNFQAQFEAEIRQLHIQTSTVMEAALQIQSSQKLAGFLKLVLNVGNRMNDGTDKASALGVKLSGLNKILEVKATSDSKLTVAHYIIQVRFNRRNTHIAKERG